MSILTRAWAKYQQLLITNPWKTQTIGTGKIDKTEKPYKQQTRIQHNHVHGVFGFKFKSLIKVEWWTSILGYTKRS